MSAKLMGLGLMAIGIFSTVNGVNDLLHTRASAFWPSTRGEIIYSKFLTPSDTTVGLGFTASVEYQYDIKGRKFTGDRISFRDVYTHNEEYYQEIVDKYPIGKIVEVFYKPSNPSESVLEKKFTNASFFLIFLGTVFLVLGIVMGRFRIQRG